MQGCSTCSFGLRIHAERAERARVHDESPPAPPGFTRARLRRAGQTIHPSAPRGANDPSRTVKEILTQSAIFSEPAPLTGYPPLRHWRWRKWTSRWFGTRSARPARSASRLLSSGASEGCVTPKGGSPREPGGSEHAADTPSLSGPRLPFPLRLSSSARRSREARVASPDRSVRLREMASSRETATRSGNAIAPGEQCLA